MRESDNMDFVVMPDDNTEEKLLVEKEKKPVLKHLFVYKHLSQNLTKEEA